MNHVSAASFMIGVMIMGRSLSEMFPELAAEWYQKSLDAGYEPDAEDQKHLADVLGK